MDRLRKLLEEKEIPYEIIQHETPIRSAREGAKFFGIDPGQTAPVLIVQSDTEHYAVIFSGDRGRVDLDELAQVLGCNRLKMANSKDVQAVTGYAVGCIPLVGLALPVIMDKRLYRYPFVYGGTGEATSTLKICPNALEKLIHVIAFWEE
jgi:prolyl-tRNA editing enzyme YbaK/EbsC (Cys-tRNA(Pro) deacylase)